MLNWTRLLNQKRRKDKFKKEQQSHTANGRFEIERDYDRILFSAPTRRLADKTQVFPLDKNDSVRTRLTHSHEVATLARSIGLRLVYENENIFKGVEDSQFLQRSVPALLAAIGLVHDLGNPPFGHQGEYAIRDWYKRNVDKVFGGGAEDATDFLNFDGNAQTVRLVSRLQILNDHFGLNLTYATLAALLKYPVPSSAVSENGWKKAGYFKSEEKMIEEVWEETGLSVGVRHPLTYIMEACDDIAYSVLDAEDTVKKGLASYYDLLRYLDKNCADDEVSLHVLGLARQSSSEFEKGSLSPQELNDCSMQMFRVHAITAMVKSVVEKFSQLCDGFLSGDQVFKGIISISGSARLCKALKAFDMDYGFKHKSVLELELRGNNYIKETMDMLWVGIHGKLSGEGESETPFGKYVYSRISESYRRIFSDEGNMLSVPYREAQLLADAISGMTDSYLISLYEELKPLYDRHCC
ncbi:dGTP triphosphohydrolase [Pseudomonas chlororaphis]|uniref:dGTP triphosphohydrolase n=1 Tax=Pseudomonas chlororaphis TaxID=587753 RepID=UPI000F582618|nr:dNTP triphosphohydrolase [Pseudomonas chlororaphis]AZE06702.1 Deoxyguanosinetriphosphate triphosphohydrolase [Pseudomonas chlororaphis subsp. aureofaciens]MBP5063403.1 dNTP triphosphohydrolase [Pseudomonas chlororaphis]QTT96025.1 dNTP triphosphohydrolase [Pseudomonas chlororaphis]